MDADRANDVMHIVFDLEHHEESWINGGYHKAQLEQCSLQNQIPFSWCVSEAKDPFDDLDQDPKGNW